MVKVEKLYCSMDSAVSIIASAGKKQVVGQRVPRSLVGCEVLGEERERRERRGEGRARKSAEGQWVEWTTATTTAVVEKGVHNNLDRALGQAGS